MRRQPTLSARSLLPTMLAAVIFAALALSPACVKGGVSAGKAPPSLIPANATTYGLVDLAGLAKNELLQDEFLARYRDLALGRLGLKVADAQKVSGLVQVFGIPGDRLAAFMPGYTHQGKKAFDYKGLALLSAGDAGEVAANVPGGCIVGHAEAVTAALEVLTGRAPWLKASPLDELVERGAEFKSIRVATTLASRFVALSPIAPPREAAAKLQISALYLTLEGSRLAAKLDMRCGDPSAAKALAGWAESARKGLRDKVAGFREMAGLFGGALEPAVAALDAIKVMQDGDRASVTVDHDLRPIFSSGLMTVLKTLQLFGN